MKKVVKKVNNEIWKPIEGFENYEVSNKGNVRNNNFHSTGKCKLIAQTPDNRGYPKVSLFKNNKRKCFMVHRLVAQAFIPNPDNLETVNHKDEVKTNNCVENLEWMSDLDNKRYGTGIARRAKKETGAGNGMAKAIYCYELDRTFGAATEAARELGIKNIKKMKSHIVNDKPSYLGVFEGIKLHWKFVENNEQS